MPFVLRRWRAKMKFMLDCRTVAGLLSQSHDDGAPRLAIQARLRLHLMTCRACRHVGEQMRFVRTAMQAAREYPPIGATEADGASTKAEVIT